MTDDRYLLTDIRLELRNAALRPVFAVATDRRRVPNVPGFLRDLGAISGRDNLGQAVLMRLLTPVGELAALGHPEYGSRLHELVGSQNTEAVRNLARLYILDSLRLEPRVEKVVEVTVRSAPREPGGTSLDGGDGQDAGGVARGIQDRLMVRLVVKPTGPAETVVIGPFVLELGA